MGTRRRKLASSREWRVGREIFGDDVVADAMVDRLVHHAAGIALKRDSYPAAGGFATFGYPMAPARPGARRAAAMR